MRDAWFWFLFSSLCPAKSEVLQPTFNFETCRIACAERAQQSNFEFYNRRSRQSFTSLSGIYFNFSASAQRWRSFTEKHNKVQYDNTLETNVFTFIVGYEIPLFTAINQGLPCLMAFSTAVPSRLNIDED